MNKALSIWHLHDVYSLDEAAWLIAGESPNEDHQYSSSFDVYNAIYGALEKALHSVSRNRLEGYIDSTSVERWNETPFPSEFVPSCSKLSRRQLGRVTILKADLIQWLDHKKHYPPFFFPEKSGETAPTEKENIHVPPDPVATLASDALPSYLSERLSSFSSHIHDAYKLRLANPKANKATLIDLMCEELGVKDLEARQIDVMIRPPKGK